MCNTNISDNHKAFCLQCQEETIPFQQLSDQQFYLTSEKGINNDVDLLNLSILPNNSLKTYFTDINNVNCHFSNNDDDDAPAIYCNYVDINSFNYKNKKDSSLFHLNIASLSKNKDEL